MSTTARVRWAFLAPAVTLLSLLSACEGSELHRPFGTSTDTDTSPDEVSSGPTIDFQLVTKGGKVGFGEDSIALVPGDEVDAYASIAGLQFDLEIATTGVADDTEVELYVDDVLLAPGVIAAGDDGAGTSGFIGVTIPFREEGVRVRVRTFDDEGDPLEEDKLIAIDLGACRVTASFVETDALCVSSVDQGGRTGVPVTVHLEEGVCETVIVTWELDADGSIAGVVPEAPFDEDGNAEVFVELGAAGDVFIGDLTVTATAQHPFDEEANGEVQIETHLDPQDPELAWVMPDPDVTTVLGPSDDVDAATDGVQVAFVVSVDEAASVTLFIDDDEVQTIEADAGDDVTFDAVTVAGSFEVRVTAADLCDNQDELTASFTVIDSDGILIENPGEGDVELAVDDQIAGNATFDNAFRVVAPAATIGSNLTVLCKTAVQDETAPFEIVGTLHVDALEPDGGYAVPVAIPAVQPEAWICIARLDFPSLESPERTFTLAFPGPTITVDAPRSNECFTTKSIAASGTTTGLNGRTIIYELDNGQSGDLGTVTEVTTQSGTFSGTIDLPAATPDGNFTLTVDGADAYGNVVSDTSGPVQVLFAVDTTDPTLAITAPAGTTIGPTGDTNPGMAGFQTTVQAQMSDSHTFGGRVCLKVNGGSETCRDLSGSAVSFTDVTLVTGTNTLVINGSDACSNVAPEVTKVVELMVQNPLVIVTPTDNATLLAVNDANPTTARVYETSFQVEATEIVLGATLSIECHGDVDPTYVQVGTILVGVLTPTERYNVPVTLDIDALGTALTCRARADLPGPSFSQEIDITVGLPRPTLSITSPASDTCQTSRTFTVAGTSTNLVGRVVTLSGATGTATVAAGDSWSATGTVATDGLVALGASATDVFGNVAAAAPVAVLVDATLPVFTLTAPTSPVDPNVVADADPVTAGYQTTVNVSVVETNGAGGEACIAVNSGTPECTTLGATTTVAFANITLQPGDNTITITGSDACGNDAVPSVNTVTVLDSGDLQVIISAPPTDLTTTNATQSFTVSVLDDLGFVAGATVTLAGDGVDSGVVATDNLDGTYTFTNVPLPADATTEFIASAQSGIRTGQSDPRTITQKTAQPTVTITSPTDGLVINLASALCEGATANCVTDITATTTNVEDGSNAHLTVDCGALAIADAVVSGNAVSFADVPLATGFDCIITVQVTDAVAQSASDSVNVTVDRVAPTVNITTPGATLTTAADDQDPATPGVQAPLRAELSGVTAGTVVTAMLTWQSGGAALPPKVLTHTVATDTDDDGIYVATFEDVAGTGLVTWPDAFVTITVTVSDEAGNQGKDTQGVAVNTVITVRIISPSDTADACAGTCTVGTCHDGACFRNWGVSDSRQIVAFVSGFTTTTNNIRVCSDHPSLALAPGAVQCSSTPSATGPFYQVLIGNAATGNVALDVSTVLPAGFQRVVVELNPGGTWVSSQTATSTIERERKLNVDLTVPVVSAVTSPSDTLPPTGSLNAAEQKAPGRQYDISFTTSEAGRAEVHVNASIVAQQDVPIGTTTLTVTLPEGAVQVWVVMTDAVGNKSPATPGQGATTLNVTVDTLVPTLAFSRPNKATLTNGDNLDVVLTSDAEGQTVTVFDGGVQVATGVVTGGSVTFAHATNNILTNGTHTLTATVSDAAGNTTTAATTPPTVLVDTDLPTVTIDEPTQGEILTDADDANAAPGFQVGVTFTTGSGATTWSLYTQTCTGLGLGCAPRVLVTSGAVTNSGGPEPVQLATLDLTGTASFHRLTVEVDDGGGNLVADTADISVVITGCQLTFTNLPANGWYNVANACAGGTPCTSATVPVTVDVVGNCGNITRMQLLDGGVEVGSINNPADPATFNLTIDDGDHLALEAKAFRGNTELGSTGVRERDADFKPPVVSFVSRTVNGFTTAAEGASVTYLAVNDLAPTTPGMQLHASVDVVDTHAAGGQITSITAGASPLTPSNLTLPYTLPAGTTVSTNLLDLTLADGQTHTVTLTASDAAGNTDTATFTAKIDVTPPAEVPITTLVMQSRRPRTLPLTFTHVGDNGMTGGPVARYEVRYSPSPITEANFSAACSAFVPELLGSSAPPVPAAPGTSQQKDYGGPDVRPFTHPCKLEIPFQQAGLDDQVWMYWAMRAQDAAGNWSPITTQAVRGVLYKDVWLKLNRVRVDTSPTSVFGANAALMTFRGVVLGDLDGGGRRELAFGSNESQAFCIVRGEALSNPDLFISTASSADHTCLLSSQVTSLFPGATNTGHHIERLGDVNGDGFEDFGVSGRTSNLAVGYVAVYFGRAGALPDLTAPNIRISGMASASAAGNAYNSWCAAGDFDGLDQGGKKTMDIAVGQSATNSNFLIVFPGQTSWTTATNLSIDVTQVDQVTANGGLRFNWQSLATQQNFAFAIRCAPLSKVWTPNATSEPAFLEVGTPDLLLTPGDSTAVKGDLAVSQTGVTDARLIVIPGRSWTAGAVETITDIGGTTPEDARVVRLRQDAAQPKSGFGSHFGGQWDLTNDGILDVLVSQPNRSLGVTTGQPSNTPGDGKSVYIFDGAKIRAAVGGEVRLNTTAATPIVDDTWVADNGFIVAVPNLNANFRALRAIGDFNNSNTNAATIDIAYGNAAATQVELRMNHSGTSRAIKHGTYPVVDGFFEDIYTAGGNTIGWWVDSGLLTNDTLYDLVTGGRTGEIIIAR